MITINHVRYGELVEVQNVASKTPLYTYRVWFANLVIAIDKSCPHIWEIEQ